jgi:hypothetical protein
MRNKGCLEKWQMLRYISDLVGDGCCFILKFGHHRVNNKFPFLLTPTELLR